MSIINRVRSLVAISFLLLLAGLVQADELRPAYLQLKELPDERFEVLWKVPALGANRRLSIDVKFDQYTRAVTELTDAAVGTSAARYWIAERQNGLQGLAFSIDGLSKTRSEVLVRIEYLDGSSITERLTPDAPAHTIAAKPGWGDTALTYFVLGVEHIWFGIDHLLFVLVLVMLVRNNRKLVITITTFTVAHSITLILAAIDWVRLPIPPVEACIALSIVFVAVEIIRAQQGQKSITQEKPWLVAFSFGLLHGLGFAAALGEIGLPENALATALLVFNLGVEAGQLTFVAAVLLLWAFVTRFINPQSMPVWLLRTPAYSIGALASFWVFERVASFWA